MGRDAAGVVGIDLSQGAKVVGLVVIAPTTAAAPAPEILTICVRGFGKRTPFEDYRLTRRGGKGVINIDVSERNGPVLTSLAVMPGDQLVIMTSKGQAIRIGVDDIGTYGRASQGVIIVNLEPGDALTSAALLPREDVQG